MEDGVPEYSGAKYRPGAALAVDPDPSVVELAPLYIEGLPQTVRPAGILTVLCVDDDMFAREALCSLFKIANEQHEVYTVHTASSAAEALALLNPDPASGVPALLPDMVLLDVIMEDMRGDEVLPMMRGLLPTAKIIMASTLSHVERVHDAGFAHRDLKYLP